VSPFFFNVCDSYRITLSAVKFTVNLHKYHNMTLSQAYVRAVSQFGVLRAEHHIATTTAALEAEAYGATFRPGAIERGFAQEQKVLDRWHNKREIDKRSIIAHKRWKAIIDPVGRVGVNWSKGQEYVRLQKEGVRPTYLPPKEPEVEAPPKLEDTADFMGLE
jgi:small subunit ribosomal protein S23